MRRIPVAVPDLSGNEQRYVADALQSSWISSTGRFIDRFEREFSQVCGADTCLTVSNGTVALHLALLTLDVRPGDEVIVPSLTYVATANAVRYVGAEPVFVDVERETWCISPEKIEEAITPRTRGIIVVHLYGHPADMDRINHVAGINGLWVVEDAAEAPFATYKGRPIGSLGTIGTFSFYGNKVITCGEGGAVTLSDPRLSLRARTLRGQGMDPNRRYYFPVTGYNFRLNNVSAAILCAQLERRSTILARRREIFTLYERLLRSVPGIGLQPLAEWATASPWLFCITIDDEFGANRDGVAEYLATRGVETRPFFIPLHTLPPFREGAAKRHSDLSVTCALAHSGLNLPTYPSLADRDVEFVVRALREAGGAR